MRNFTHSAAVINFTGKTMSNDFGFPDVEGEIKLDQPEVRYVAKKLKAVKRRFPGRVDVDEVKVIEDLDGSMAEALQQVRSGKVRYTLLIDKAVFGSKDWIVEATMAHEMVHMYCYQKGYDDLSDGDPMFEWMCGRVGALQTDFNPKDHQFKELIVPFMKQADHYRSDS